MEYVTGKTYCSHMKFIQKEHGCHRSGNGQGKRKFFKVREMSGNFILGQGPRAVGGGIGDFVEILRHICAPVVGEMKGL